jgi:hypothetical protein
MVKTRIKVFVFFVVLALITSNLQAGIPGITLVGKGFVPGNFQPSGLRITSRRSSGWQGSGY